MLEIRQEIAKSSLKKLDAMQRCAGPGDRVRGQLAYYGAFRTGRFAGRLIQPQNFPRPPIKDVNSFTRYMLRTKTPDADFVRCVWGKPLDAIATALRGCLVPATGKVFVVRDLSQIEARVIAWLAGQDDLLTVFEGGTDVYVYMQHKLGLPSRQAAKAATLGLGFGMGPAHFVDYALTYGVIVSAQESEAMVKDWRAGEQLHSSLLVSARRRGGGSAARLQRRNLDHPLGQPVHLVHGVQGAQRDDASDDAAAVRATALLPQRAAWCATPTRAATASSTRAWTRTRRSGRMSGRGAPNSQRTPRRPSRAMSSSKRRCGSTTPARDDLVLSVHDELVFEVDDDVRCRQRGLIKTEIDARPVWAPDLPVASEGRDWNTMIATAKG